VYYIQLVYASYAIMSSKYECLKIDGLARLIAGQQSELDELKKDPTTNETAITLKTTELSDMIKAMQVVVSKPSDNSTVGKVYESDRMSREISNSISRIDQFQATGIEELNSFIGRLDQIYNEMVTEDHHRETFLRQAKLALGGKVYDNCTSHKANLQTFDQFKDWLKKTYGTQVTGFQLLSKAWDAEFDAKEKFVVYAQKIENALRTANTHIQSKFKEKNEAKAEMTGTQMLDIVGAMLVTEELRKQCNPVYCALVNNMDDLTTASKVAAQAELYREQFGAQENPKPTAALVSNSNSKSNKKKKPNKSKSGGGKNTERGSGGNQHKQPRETGYNHGDRNANRSNQQHRRDDRYDNRNNGRYNNDRYQNDRYYNNRNNNDRQNNTYGNDQRDRNQQRDSNQQQSNQGQRGGGNTDRSHQYIAEQYHSDQDYYSGPQDLDQHGPGFRQ